MDPAEEWENLNLELKKIPKTADSIPEFLRHLMKMFVADFETSMSKRLDVKFWKNLKKLMEEMRTASENDPLVEVNTQNLAHGLLKDLSLICHVNYEIPDFGLPRQMTFTPAVHQMTSRKLVKSRKNCKVFAAYMMLRMGDLMRYKQNLKTAKEYYELSAKLNPADGSAWNQLGIIAFLTAQNLESVYFHTRALHATHGFPNATTSLAVIFKKFANHDTSREMPINELFLVCLSKIHFLLEIPNSPKILEKIGEAAATSKEMVVSLMSIYEHLEDGTELENRAVGYVNDIWRHANRRLLKKLLTIDPTSSQEEFERLLHILALLRSVSELIEEEDDVRRLIAKIQDFSENSENSEEKPLSDPFGYAHFHCLDTLDYPLKMENFEKILIGETEKIEDDSFDIQTKSDDSSAFLEEKDNEEKRNYHKESDSSDEEILRRGARRGRIATADQPDSDEDLEDDDDF